MTRKSTTTTVGGLLARVDREGMSAMGNPTWRLTFSDGRTFLTQTNGSVGYSAENFRPRYGHAATPVILTLTKAGRVQDITHADGSR